MRPIEPSARLVCLIGIDGTGKTSHAKAAVRELMGHGLRCRYTWCRGSPRIFLPLILFLKRTIMRDQRHEKSITYQTDDFWKRSFLSSRVLSKVWISALLVDTFLQTLINVRLPLALGKIVVSDRYIYDQMVDIAADFDFSKDDLDKWVNNRVYKLFPRPAITFLLDIDERVAYSRQAARKIDVRSLSYLKARRAIYHQLREWIPMTVIDASEKYNAVQEAIGNRVLQQFDKRV